MRIEISIDLPQGWVFTQLGELGLFINGDRGKNYPNKTALVESGIPFINAGHIQDGIINLSEMNYITKERFNLLGSGKVEPNDILYCLRGSLGKTAIVENITTGAIASSLVIIRPSDYSKYEYLYYFLISPFGDAEIRKHDNGSAQPNLSAKSVRSYFIPLPPLNEQKRIVTKIEALQTRSIAVKEELEAIKPLLNQFRQSVLASAFRGDLTKDWREQNPDVEPALILAQSNYDLASDNLPASWCQALVGNVVENLKYGTSKKCRYEIDGVPVLRIPNIVDGTINHSDIKYAELPDKEHDKLKLISGDILMIRSNGSASLVGKTAIISEAEKDFAYAGYLIRLRPNKNLVYPEYLNLWFSSYEIRLQIEVPLRSTSGVNNINSEETKKLNIPVAPLKEQEEIVCRIESLFKLADNIEQQYQQAEVDLETLNQSILAKAFRGELVPQDPNDEPASALLERIKKEREKETAAKKSKTKKKRSAKKKDKQLGIPGM